MEILGLLDTLESMILEGFRIPLTRKTLVNEDKLLSVIDKIRNVAQGGGNPLKDSIKRPITGRQESLESIEARNKLEKIKESLPAMSRNEENATEIIEHAYKIAKEVRMGADKYADEVLTNLEATSSRILRAVKAGRSRLGKFVTGVTQEESKGEER